MENDTTPALQVLLNLDGQPTFGALRVFVNLSQDMPDSAALGLIRDATTDALQSLARFGNRPDWALCRLLDGSDVHVASFRCGSICMPA